MKYRDSSVKIRDAIIRNSFAHFLVLNGRVKTNNCSSSLVVHIPFYVSNSPDDFSIFQGDKRTLHTANVIQNWREEYKSRSQGLASAVTGSLCN